MKYLTGKDRNQIPLFVGSLEEAIEADNEVRLLEALDQGQEYSTLNFRRIFNVLPKNALKSQLIAAILFWSPYGRCSLPMLPAADSNFV